MSGMDLTPYKEFAQDKLGIEFSNINLLVDAFTHRSYINEHKKSASVHNERLEFLGDAILELVVTDYLFRKFDEPEGTLTAWRSALVRTESIGAAGRRVGYEPLMRMSRGEKQGSERSREQILANAFEALIGAIYLEKGYQTVKEFIEKHIISTLPQILKSGSWRDPKSYIQEIMQRVDGLTPSYKLLEEEGPDHDKVFTIGLYREDELISQGKGSSKQAAQQEAAKKAIEIYNRENID